jgi:hypothetical protein
MTIYTVTLMNGLNVRKVDVLLGESVDRIDIENAIKRMGLGGEIIGYKRKGK